MVNTVLGEIELDALGNVLSHEHILVHSPIMRAAFGERIFEMQRVADRALELLSKAKTECGVDTVIDGTPLDLGRNIELIREVSERSGVNIIVSSGMYITEEHFMARRTPCQFAKLFTRECRDGIYGTNIKPGILKCATGYNSFTDINKMVLEAVAITQKETGLPLFAHNTNSIKTAYEQIRLFEKNGADIEKVIIGHCSDTEDTEYLLDIAKSGCFLGFDRIYPYHYVNQARVMMKLIDAGYEDRLLVSHDFFAFSDSSGESFEEQAKSERSFTTVHKELIPELLRLGATEAQVHKLTYENPKNLFM